jgi:hypothetical protein
VFPPFRGTAYCPALDFTRDGDQIIAAIDDDLVQIPADSLK